MVERLAGRRALWSVATGRLMMTADDPLAGWATTDDPEVLTALVRRHSDAVYG